MKREESQRTVLVTGGASGIGEAICERLSKEDFAVSVTDIRKSQSTSCLFYRCDVRKRRQINHLYDWVKRNHGIPDILILNAGVGIKEKIAEGDPEKWQKVMDVNVMGALRVLRAFLPEMLLRKSGHIIFISSVSANQPHLYGGIYTASKTALDVIAETLRLETLPHLKITTISPGATDTSFFKNQLAGISHNDYNLPLMSPKDIAEDVLYTINRDNDRTINKIITRHVAQEF